ncbi:hypothetical protein P7C70_g8322, partial [Phenoliferia sp. Uapishka_3]
MLQPSPRSTSTTGHRNLDPAHPLGVLAEASSFVSAKDSADRPDSASPGTDAYESPRDMGIANSSYFNGKGEPVGQTSPILEMLEVSDIEELFRLFLDNIWVHLPIVERKRCTPLLVLQRSPPLFNAICCVSVKYYTAKPHLLAPLRQLAMDELAKFPTEKSLEFVQSQLAYLTWAVVPTASHDDDMTWVRMGMTVRMALDLNMHRAGKIDMGNSEKISLYEYFFGLHLYSAPEWRVKSMRRTWLICMILEKTMAVQMGKPSLLWSHGVVQADLEENPGDSVELTRIFTATEYSQLLERTLDTTTLMRSLTVGMDNDLPDVDVLFQRQLENWRERGQRREAARDGALPEGQKAIQRARYKLYFSYGQLIIASVGLQHSIDNDSTYKPFALAKYQTAALSVLHTFRDDWAAPGFSPYCTDFQYSYVLYAAVSLLKSVQVQFSHSLLERVAVGRLISNIANLLEDAARVWDHLPLLQSKFLRRVLKARVPEFEETPRGPLPTRLIIPEALSAHQSQVASPDLSFPQSSAVDYQMNGQEDLWMQNDFTETTFGRSDLFSWDDFVGT